MPDDLLDHVLRAYTQRPLCRHEDAYAAVTALRRAADRLEEEWLNADAEGGRRQLSDVGATPVPA